MEKLGSSFTNLHYHLARIDKNINRLHVQCSRFFSVCMNKIFLIFTLFFTSLFACKVNAQNNRINTKGNMGWYNIFGTFKLNDKFGAHTEFQWRRDNFITDRKQSLLRLGLNYQYKPNILFRAGYALIETFNYGEIPINAFGRDFTEHRIYEMVQLAHQEGKVELTHRFMLEQRFVGRYSSPNLKTEDEFPFMNRARYMFRAQLPLKGKQIEDNTPYAAFYDEIFIGFGKNVNANIFDQNRLGILVGYRFDKNLRIEGGYLSQILQFGRQIDGNNVFQNNNGIIVNIYLNFFKKGEPDKTHYNYY